MQTNSGVNDHIYMHTINHVTEGKILVRQEIKNCIYLHCNPLVTIPKPKFLNLYGGILITYDCTFKIISQAF